MKMDRKTILKIALYVVSTITLLNGVSTLQEKKNTSQNSKPAKFCLQKHMNTRLFGVFLFIGWGVGEANSHIKFSFD